MKKSGRHRWRVSSEVVLLEDIEGHGGERFKKGTRMRVASMPMWDDEDRFGLQALDKPEFLPNGPWRGASHVKRRQFECRWPVK